MKTSMLFMKHYSNLNETKVNVTISKEKYAVLIKAMKEVKQ